MIPAVGITSNTLLRRSARYLTPTLSQFFLMPPSFSSKSPARSKVPSSQVTELWGKTQAVCFDVDGTLTKQDGLEDLAHFLGKGEEVKPLTTEAMNGDMELDEALQSRLDAMDATLDNIKSYVESKPAEKRLVPGAKELIQELQARKIQVFLVSEGFRELVLPVADELGIPRTNLFANRFFYKGDDKIMDAIEAQDVPNSSEDSPLRKIRVRAFDPSNPKSRMGGKANAIRTIRAKKHLQTVAMVGDGVADLDAVQKTDAADLFIGYGGVNKIRIVQDNADWFVTDYQELLSALPRFKVAMIGSGAFASTMMQAVCQNAKQKNLFQDRVDMYVYEEDYNGGKLSEAINEQHRNPKYMPDKQFGENGVANPDLEDTVRGADLLIFCAPLQFMHQICKKIRPVVKSNAKAISLTKGIHISEDQGPQLMSSMIHRMLDVDCSVLMGANLAKEIGPGGLSEGTIGSRSAEQGQLFQALFETDYFETRVITDIEGAELAGALKNIVAVASGFADGSDLGENAKSAILRQGLNEMRSFAKAMYPSVRDETFFESCGVADLIATCYGGRNHMVSEAYAKEDGSKSFEQLEKELLNGQKLQGPQTTEEVYSVLSNRGWERDYPLFTTVHAVLQGLCKPKDIRRFREIALSDLSVQSAEKTLLEKTMGL